MTRENKLALVVGFALILFIGILISDHFSVARSQVSANLANQAIADPLTTRMRDEEDLIAIKDPPPAAPLLQPGEPAANPTHMAAVESMTPEQRSMIDHTTGITNPTRGNTDLVAGANTSRIPQHVEPVNAANPSAGHAEITAIRSREGETIQIDGFEPVREEAVVNLADMRFHDVHNGESLFAICKQYYGDTSMVKALAKFNNMDDPAQVRSGRKLMIPPPETLGGKVRATPSRGAQPASTSELPSALVKTQTSETRTPAKPKTYTIKAGDSLSVIAQRVLGDKEKWRDLHRLNRKVIDDPDNLKVGTVIRLL